MKRIQIIEDDESIRSELKMLLSANGYCPVDEPPCDLILMDVNLPGKTDLPAAGSLDRPLTHR